MGRDPYQAGRMCEQQLYQRNRYSHTLRVYETVHIEKTHPEEDQDIMKQGINGCDPDSSFSRKCRLHPILKKLKLG